MLWLSLVKIRFCASSILTKSSTFQNVCVLIVKLFLLSFWKINLFICKWMDSFLIWCNAYLKRFSVLSLHQNGWPSLLHITNSLTTFENNLFILFSICSFYNSFNCFLKICYKLCFYKKETCSCVKISIIQLRKQVLHHRIKDLQRISICSWKISKIKSVLILVWFKSLVRGVATV